MAKNLVIAASVIAWLRFGRNRNDAVRTRANAKQRVERHVPDGALFDCANLQLDLSSTQQFIAWRQSATTYIHSSLHGCEVITLGCCCSGARTALVKVRVGSHASQLQLGHASNTMATGKT